MRVMKKKREEEKKREKKETKQERRDVFPSHSFILSYDHLRNQRNRLIVSIDSLATTYLMHLFRRSGQRVACLSSCGTCLVYPARAPKIVYVFLKESAVLRKRN